MLAARSLSPLPALLLGLAVALAAPAAEAKRKGGQSQRSSCKKDERRVVKGTPAYGGPGLGFDVTYVFPRSSCVDVLRTTEDGSFALVPIADGRVAWVAAGLIEADLSEEKGAEPSAVTAPYEVIALRPLSVRKHPRFAGRVVTTTASQEVLKVTGTSPDGLWLFVEAKGGKGWVSRYQTAKEPPASGSAPTAGSGAWSVRGAPVSEQQPPVAATTKEAPTQEQKVADSPESEEEEAPAVADEASAPESEVALPLSSKLLGRGHEVSFAVSFAQWSQRYLSDAQNDAFYKYELSSAGPSALLSYAYRGDFPLVFDVRGAAGLFGFDLVPPGETDAAYTSVFTLDLATHLGWRLHGDEIVDVEAGLGSGLSLVWVGDLEAQGGRIDAFTPGLYLEALRPYVAARSRLAGGELGLVSLEAAVPLGGYLMVYDPGANYRDSYANVPIVDAPKPLRPDEEAPDPDAETPAVHPFVGVEGRLRYALPLGDVVRLRMSFGLGVRQAFLSGPGVRVNGIYTEATNIDVLGSFDLGADFSF